MHLYVCHSMTPTMCLCVCLFTEEERPVMSGRLSRVSELLEGVTLLLTTHNPWRLPAQT